MTHAVRGRVRCPICGKNALASYLAVHGRCCGCVKWPQRGPNRDLTGREKDLVLAQFAAWLDLNPDPWQRAIGGLRMFVPDNGRAAWP